MIPHFDYPGGTAREWNNTYTGSGPYSGVNPDRPNTAYVHIDTTTIPKYKTQYGTVTVIRYRYFYPYNDWWNNHEGDWQGIDVVVTSRSPATAKFLGVEYRFHGAWLSYYKDYDNKPTITNSVVFDPQRAVRLIGTHPVAYIGAGSHAAYPIGGEIDIHSVTEIVTGNEGARGEVGGDKEYMSHTGLVLSTLADGSHSDLWEGYNLELLPDPDPTNTNNMGLTPAMSWLGAQIRWGTPVVHGPSIVGFPADNVSPHGPYAGEEKRGWGKLKLFTVGSIVGDSFHHSDLERTSYHHWAIIGPDTLSGTVSLYGDVVVFPGSKLTIKPGTVVTFPAGHDRHQFSAPDNRYYFSEIFVYGILESQGTSGNPVVLGGTDPANTAERWGGLRKLGSGSVSLGDHTTIRNAKPVQPVFVRTVLTPDPASVSVDWKPTNDPVISGYQTRISPDGTTWPAWSDWTEAYGTGGMYRYTETGLREKKDYWLSVRAFYDTPLDPGILASDTLLVQVTTLGTEADGEVVLEPSSPRVGQVVTATLTDADGYIAGASWTWETRPVGGSTWSAVVGSADGAGAADTTTTDRYTPTALDLGKELRARVSYRDGHGTNTDTAESAASAAVASSNTNAPTIAGPDSVSYAENATVDVGSYTASDADGHQIQWLTLDGTDKDAFVLTGTDTDATRALQFVTAPNFEQQPTYHVTLRVQDKPNEPIGQAEDPNPAKTTALPVTVNITDVQEPPGKPVVTVTVPDTNGHTSLHVRWTVENTGPPATYNLLWCVSADCAPAKQTLVRYLTVTDTTLTGLRPATAYAVGVQATNAEGNGPWNDSTTATTAAPNRAPVVTGLPAPSVEENTPVVGPYTATDADGDTLRWSRAGADAAAFALVGTDSTRTLQFTTAPNYEQPADANGDSVYAVALIATDDGTPPLADTLTVSVRVQDADDPGTLTLSSLTPQVGDLLRATLTDEDAPLVFEPNSLQWSYFYAVEGAEATSHGLEEHSRILSVSTVHLGSRLLATMYYADRHGPQSAISDTTAAVVGPPWPPQGLTATAGDGQVDLSWQPPVRLGGSAIVRYEYWHSGKAAGGVVVGGRGRFRP